MPKRQRFYTKGGKVRPVTPRKSPTFTHQTGVAHLSVPKAHRIPASSLDNLYIYYKNDRELYRRSDAWAQNFSRKMKGGRYDERLAKKAIEKHLVPEILKKYKQDNDTQYVGQFYVGAVSKADKRAIAENIFPEIEERAKYYSKETGKSSMKDTVGQIVSPFYLYQRQVEKKSPEDAEKTTVSAFKKAVSGGTS